MSYRDRRDSHGSSSSRYDSRRPDDRRSGASSSSRRSPSPPPKPRSDKELPESFGRIVETAKDIDDSNVLQRMSKKFVNAPLGSLTKCLEGSRKIKVWTRNFKEVRGICTGYVIAFDKHWNLVMSDVDEVYLKPRKSKTPFLESLQAAENFSELPKRVPKKKKDPKSQEKNPPPPEPPVESGTESAASGTEGGKKKKRRSKKKKRPSPQKRHIKKIFVRGDNIVMAAVMDASEGEAEEEEEEGEED